jgi:hypothetical protein
MVLTAPTALVRSVLTGLYEGSVPSLEPKEGFCTLVVAAGVMTITTTPFGGE